MEYKESGQLAYEAYHLAKYAKNQKHTWTWWPDVDDEQEKDAWRHAAHEVMQKGWTESSPSAHR